MTCLHADTVPVYAYLHAPNPQPGGPVDILNGGQPVARLCPDCDQQLPTNWGCPDCEWETYESRRLCDPEPHVTTICTRPCKEHT